MTDPLSDEEPTLKRYFFVDGVPETTERNDYGDWVRYEDAAEIIRLLQVGDDDVCETCANWTRLAPTSNGESTCGECSEWSCDGIKPLLFESEFCSRWMART